MTTQTTSPAQAAAIRHSYGMRKAVAAKKAAQAAAIRQSYKDKARKAHLDTWLKNKIKDGYRARAAANRAQQAA